MRGHISRKTLKRCLMVALAGLTLTVLTGCYLGGGPLRHAFFWGGHHRGGHGYHAAPFAGPHLHPETRGDRHGRYDGE